MHLLVFIIRIYHDARSPGRQIHSVCKDQYNFSHGTSASLSGGNNLMRSLTVCTAHQYYSSDQTDKNEMVGHVARMEEWRGIYRILVGKPEGKRPLGRRSRR